MNTTFRQIATSPEAIRPDKEEDMSPRWYYKKSLIRMFFFCLAIFLLAESYKAALAQCGDYPPASSCYTCHEETYPVFSKGEWHEIHARKDCCWNCHGGNTQAQDKDLAHEGITLQPLNDTYTDCYACHPNDFQDRAERFGAALGVAPVSHAPTPATPVPSNPDEDLQLVIPHTPAQATAPAVPWYPELFCIAFGVAFFLGYYLRSKAHPKRLGH
jgi:hypothetical protein